MTSRIAREGRRALRDPALVGAIIVLWLLLALFVLYPLAHLLARAFSDEGRFTLEPLLSAVADPGNRAAFFNSLLLATTVGAFGTILGFVFAMTAARAGLGRHWLDCARCRDAAAAGVAAVHDVHRHHLFVRPQGLHQPSPAGPRQCQRLRLLEHDAGRDADILSDRLSHPGGRSWPPSTPISRRWRSAWAARDGGLSGRSPFPSARPLRKRFPAAVCRFPGRFCDAADPRRQQLPRPADASLPADHRDVRLQERRGAVVDAAGSRRRGLPSPTPLGRPAHLRHRDRQGRPALALARRRALGLGPSGFGEPLRRRGHPLFLRPAPVRLAGRGVRSQRDLHLAALSCGLHGGPAGNTRHP